MAVQRMHFDIHVTTKFAKRIKQSFNTWFVFWKFGIAQKMICYLAVVFLVHQTHWLLSFYGLKMKTSGKCT